MPMYFFDVLESNGSVTRDMVAWSWMALKGRSRPLPKHSWIRFRAMASTT